MRAYARAAARAFEVTIKIRVIHPFAYLNWLLFPIIFSSISLFVLGAGGSGPRTAYAVFGSGLIGYWTAAYLDGGNSIQQERWEGMLEPLLGTPTPLPVILAGKTAASLLLGLGSFVPSLLIATWGFHASLPIVDPLGFAISFAAITLSFFAISMTFAPLFALWRWAFSMLNGFEVGFYVFGGFAFPVVLLGPWAQGVAGFLAPSWATTALYAATQPGPHHYLLDWAVSLALSALYLGVSVLLFRLVNARARISGQLAVA